MFDSLEIIRQDDGETFRVYIDDEEPVYVTPNDVYSYPLIAAIAFTAHTLLNLEDE